MHASTLGTNLIKLLVFVQFIEINLYCSTYVAIASNVILISKSLLKTCLPFVVRIGVHIYADSAEKYTQACTLKSVFGVFQIRTLTNQQLQ